MYLITSSTLPDVYVIATDKVVGINLEVQIDVIPHSSMFEGVSLEEAHAAQEAVELQGVYTRGVYQVIKAEKLRAKDDLGANSLRLYGERMIGNNKGEIQEKKYNNLQGNFLPTHFKISFQLTNS